MSMYKEKLLEEILNFYLESRDFNGLPLSDFISKFKKVSDAKKILEDFIKTEKIDFYYDEGNPHVKRFDPSKNRKKQIEFLLKLPKKMKKNVLCEHKHIQMVNYGEFSNVCLYPSEKLLKEKIGNKKKYLEYPPFKKLVSFGKAQLDFLYFKIDVLDRYLQDPRYRIHYGDYIGDISFTQDVSEEDEENLFLKSFGLAYNRDTKEILICALVCDLFKMIPKQQHHFYSFQKENNNILPDPDFFKNSIIGDFTDRHSIFIAFIEEMSIINTMTNIFIKENLFKNDFQDIKHNRPEFFHPFLKPTKATYYSFCKVLDKLFTENINLKCILKMNNRYGNKMNIEEKDSSLTLLQKFFETYFKPQKENSIYDDVIRIWKKEIRVQRSKDSHNITTNQYDISIFQKYSETMEKAYISIRTIRLIFSTLSIIKFKIENKEINIPEWLYLGKIRNYFRIPYKKP